jgi:hypothetical protein
MAQLSGCRLIRAAHYTKRREKKEQIKLVGVGEVHRCDALAGIISGTFDFPSDALAEAIKLQAGKELANAPRRTYLCCELGPSSCGRLAQWLSEPLGWDHQTMAGGLQTSA